MKNFKNPLLFVVGLLFTCSILLSFGLPRFGRSTNVPVKKTIQQTTPSEAPDSITYEGREGVDALTLLQEHYAVEQDPSGLVTGINGKKADTAKKEFWAFYTNGIMALTGPQEYISREGDVLSWKIEKY